MKMKPMMRPRTGPAENAIRGSGLTCRDGNGACSITRIVAWVSWLRRRTSSMRVVTFTKFWLARSRALSSCESLLSVSEMRTPSSVRARTFSASFSRSDAVCFRRRSRLAAAVSRARQTDSWNCCSRTLMRLLSCSISGCLSVYRVSKALRCVTASCTARCAAVISPARGTCSGSWLTFSGSFWMAVRTASKSVALASIDSAWASSVASWLWVSLSDSFWLIMKSS